MIKGIATMISFMLMNSDVKMLVLVLFLAKTRSISIARVHSDTPLCPKIIAIAKIRIINGFKFKNNIGIAIKRAYVCDTNHTDQINTRGVVRASTTAIWGYSILKCLAIRYTNRKTSSK
jgi:hypothetical protein